MFPVFWLLDFKAFTVSSAKSNAPKNIVKYFRRNSTLSHFPENVEDFVNLILVMELHFELNFW